MCSQPLSVPFNRSFGWYLIRLILVMIHHVRIIDSGQRLLGLEQDRWSTFWVPELLSSIKTKFETTMIIGP